MTTALPISPPIAPSSSHNLPTDRTASVPSTPAVAAKASALARAVPLTAPRAPASGVGVQPSRERAATPAPAPAAPSPRPAPPLPRSTSERLLLGRERIRQAAMTGQRIRSYEVALDVDLSEFHFARLFRVAFGRSPHTYYDETRAERARMLLREGLTERDVTRLVGFRRPGELRALLARHADAALPVDETGPGNTSAE